MRPYLFVIEPSVYDEPEPVKTELPVDESTL